MSSIISFQSAQKKQHKNVIPFFFHNHQHGWMTASLPIAHMGQKLISDRKTHQPSIINPWLHQMINNSPERPLPIKVRHASWTRENYEWICRDVGEEKIHGSECPTTLFISLINLHVQSWVKEAKAKKNHIFNSLLLLRSTATWSTWIINAIFSTVRFNADPFPESSSSAPSPTLNSFFMYQHSRHAKCAKNSFQFIEL